MRKLQDGGVDPLISSGLSRGIGGEELVCVWLRHYQWTIVARRWRCPWGELDIIAQDPQANGQGVLAFIEVKTRRRGSWDSQGLDAITPKKRQNLWTSALAFLGEYPQFGEAICRFDVALVQCVPGASVDDRGAVAFDPGTGVVKPNFTYQGDRFSLVRYLANVFGEDDR